MNFNEEERELFNEADVLVEANRTYTIDEVNSFSNKVIEHIMSFSKEEIPIVRRKFEPLLFKIS